MERGHARYVDGLFKRRQREASLVVDVDRTTITRCAIERHRPPRHVFGRPRFLNVPLAVVRLHLHHGFGFLTDVLQVVIEPAKEFHRPVHAAHVGVGFSTVAAAHLAVPVGLVGVVVGPLPGNRSGVDTGVAHQLVSGEGVVGVDVPILHAPDKVHAPLVVGQHVGEMPSLVPVVVPVSTAEFSTGPGGQRVERPDRIVGAHAHVVGGRVGRRTFVEGVIEHGPAFRRTVAVEHFLNADGAGNRNDGFEVRRGLLSSFPIRGAGVGFAHQADVAVRPFLLTQPVHNGLDTGLFAQSFHVLAVGGLAGTERGGLSQGVAVGDERVVNPFSDASVGNRVGR